MTVSTITIGQIGTKIVEDQQLDATAEEIQATAVTLFDAEFDNTQNSADTYIKLYDISTAPGVGTLAPNMIIKVPAGKKSGLPPTDAVGISFAAGLFSAAVTAGGKGGTTSPINPVISTFLI